MNVSEFVWKRLQEWGLKRVFGYPGDGVGGLDVALQKALPDMEYVQVRHEEMAAFMASAHAKFTGGVGLCYATSGPGAIHLLNGLYDAKMDNQPVVAIVGQQARTALGARYQQEVDLVALFKDVASDYVAIGTVPSQVRHMVDRAVRIAQTKRSVTCIILPNDLQLMEYEDPPLAHGFTHTGVGFPAESKVPESQGLRDAAKVLNEGKKVAMLVGAGCLEATDEVLAVAGKATIIVSLGSKEGLKEGDTLELYQPTDVKDDKGNVVFTDEKLVGEITLQAVQEDKSRASYSGDVQVQQGWTVKSK